MSKDKFAINYVNADGEIKRGFISQENTKESFPDPESGEYYGLEYFKNGKRVIQVIEKSAFLKAIPCINDTNKIIDISIVNALLNACLRFVVFFGDLNLHPLGRFKFFC